MNGQGDNTYDRETKRQDGGDKWDRAQNKTKLCVEEGWGRNEGRMQRIDRIALGTGWREQRIWGAWGEVEGKEEEKKRSKGKSMREESEKGKE